MGSLSSAVTADALKKLAPDANAETLLKLQIKLRKIDLNHAKEMKKLEMADRAQERQYELVKLERMKETAANRPMKIIELSKLEQSPRRTEIKALPPVQTEETEDTDYEEVAEEGPDDEEVLFDEELREEYAELVAVYLDNENEQWDATELQDLLGEVTDLLKRIRKWAKKHQVAAEEYEQNENLRGIAGNLEEYLEEIASQGRSGRKTIVRELEEEWQDELRGSLGWFD